MGYVEGIFLVIPKNKKIGDTWTEFDSTKTDKTTSVYSLASMNKDSAKITFTSTKITSTTFEAQGMQMNIELETKSAGEITVEPKNGHVNKRTSNLDTTGTVEVMGQTTPITMKGTAITTVTY